MSALDIPLNRLGVGVHEIPVDEYHADPCEDVSLSASGIKILLDQTPAHFMAQSRRLSPWPIEEVEKKPTAQQILGQAVHRLVLGRGNDIAVISGFDTWHKKEAQSKRDEAAAAGYIPLLEKTWMRAQAVSQYAIDALKARFGGWPIGESEQTLIWRRGGGLWCRALADHFSHKTATILDVKTTSRLVTDDELAKKFASEGADIQARWYTEGAETIFPKLLGLVQFIFVVCEVEAPYQVRFVKLSESWLTRAGFRIDRAARLFAGCLENRCWPGFEDGTAVLNAPAWMESRWETEELSNDVEDVLR